VRQIFGSLYCLTLAAFIGLGLTWFALSNDIAIGALQIGAWSAQPKSGTVEVDPYARAEFERGGWLPIGLGDGVAFTARTDDKGNTLDGRCDVTIAGVTPQARYFTVSLYTYDGKLLGNPLGRNGFTSQELIRNNDGSFQISVGPRSRPGNWLPTSGVERYLLALRLYDTPIGIATRTGREAPMPAIVTGQCS
jgi:hypothetical protein